MNQSKLGYYTDTEKNIDQYYENNTTLLSISTSKEHQKKESHFCDRLFYVECQRKSFRRVLL